MPERKKIVVTGLGAVSPLGLDLASTWEGIVAGRSGIKRIESFDISEYTCQIAGSIPQFDATAFMDPKEAKRNDRYTHFAVAAAKLAVEDAGLDTSRVEPLRFGAVVGTGVGGIESIEKQTRVLVDRGPRKLSPFMVPMIIVNMASGVVAIHLGAKGPNFCTVSACSSGAHAIGEAMRLMRNDEADVMVAGGTEASITPLGIGGFCAMKAMSTHSNDAPEKASRPFDANRDGFVMGEGAGLLVLETEEHARARGARIYCELAGYGATCDAHHITSPDPEGRGLSECIARALGDAQVQASDVQYINAHGTSTSLNDKFETMAVHKAFGEHAGKLIMSSTKSMTGHLLGAAGGLEAILTIKAMEDGIIPPTINYETPDPDCDIPCAPNAKIEREIHVAVSNNLGFGGHNATLVFKRS